MFLPLFPNLSFTPDFASRVGKAFGKVKSKEIMESAFVDLLSRITGMIMQEITESPRVKGDFERMLPSLLGKKLCLKAEELSSWVFEIVPLPQVVSLKLSKDEEVDKLPGFETDFEFMKAIITGTADMKKVQPAINAGRLKLINASPSNPASWFRELFVLLGPPLERKDLTQKAIAKVMPTIDSELREFGC
jgi:hypothetical protein